MTQPLAEETIKSVLEALAFAESPLAARLSASMVRDQYEPTTGRRGESSYGRYPLNLEPQEIEQIRVELRQVEGRLGYSATFGSYQLNLIIDQWERFQKEA